MDEGEGEEMSMRSSRRIRAEDVDEGVIEEKKEDEEAGGRAISAGDLVTLLESVQSRAKHLVVFGAGDVDTVQQIVELSAIWTAILCRRELCLR